MLEFQLQHQSFQWIFRIEFFEDWLVWSPCSPRDSQEPVRTRHGTMDWFQIGKGVLKGWTARRSNQSILNKSIINICWKDWCWSWSSNNFASWCEGPTHWKPRPWCWKGLKTGGEGDNRGWYGWMASLTQWTWIWEHSGKLWKTGKPGILHSMELQQGDPISPS